MSEHSVTRQLLTEIERDPAISQKRLSEQIGISVGMINWHVKRCVNKGLIKLQQTPVRRYLYYLTPDGFAEKAKLTAEYLQSSFNIFQKGRQQYDALFALAGANGWDNLALIGDTELTELALLVASQYPQIHILGIIDDKAPQRAHGAVVVYSCPKALMNAAAGKKLQAAIACHYLIGMNQAIDTEHFLKELGLDSTKLLIPGLLQ